jgi:asparagine synthetase B (glutamine-hydrolysing)
VTGVAQPLANLLAFGAKDPALVERRERQLRGSGRYSTIWRPHPHWVLAARPLPRTLPDDAAVQAAGVAFAQGRNEVLGADRDAPGALARFTRDLRLEPHALTRWPGDIACLHVAADGGLHAMRSCSGLAPVYWWSTAQAVVASTEIAELIRLGGWSGRLHPLATALACSGYLSSFDNLTHLEGVQQLQPGESLSIAPDGATKLTRYWMPLPKAVSTWTPQSEREHQEELRSLLLRELGRELDPAGGNLLGLSGGVDSSSLLALGAGTLGLPVMTFSLVPPPSAASHERELGFIRSLRERTGVRRSWERDLTGDTLEQLFQSGPPLPRPVIHPTLCALPGILEQEKVQVLFGGEFADEICGSAYTLPDWCAATTFPELLGSYRRWPKGWTSLPRWFKVRAREALGMPYLMLPDRLGAWCQPDVHAEFAAHRRKQARWALGLSRIHRSLFVHHATLDFAAMNWEVCSHLDIRRCIPFLTRGTIELASRCHPAEMVGPGTKRLLRGALVRDVPHDHLFRSDKGNFGYDLEAVGRDPGALDLGNDRIWSPLESIVAPAWRAEILRRGQVAFGDLLCLLALKTLACNVQAAQRTEPA